MNDEVQLNRVEITGVLVERKALRYTPAGVPVAECVITHQSEQIEAGISRSIEFEVQAIGLGEAANWLQAATPGVRVHLTGFLATKGQSGKQLRVHVNTIEFVEGNQNG